MAQESQPNSKPGAWSPSCAPRIGSLELRGISKEFGGVFANEGIDLTVRSGEVLALLGENGAGKTTLMNVLYGLYAPDAGLILVNGMPVAIRSPKDAIRLGIGMVHQHFMLIPRHSVAENAALGLEGTPFLRPAAWVSRRIEDFASRYDIKVRPSAPVWRLSAGEQQRVEIVKALIKGAELLILDEPTSVLTDSEADELFAVVRRMTAEGKSVIFITHKLDEVLAASTRVAVLRRGRVAGVMPTAEASKEGLARLMTGKESIQAASRTAGTENERTRLEDGGTALQAVELSVDDDLGLPAVRHLSFSVRRGEVLGVAGVSGNGQRELAEALTGLRPLAGGSFQVNGAPASRRSCRDLRSLGVRHVPEERNRLGIVAAMSVAENAVLSSYGEERFCDGIFLNGGSIRRHAEEIIERYGIKTPSADARAGSMSGGNIQKLILGRETEGSPALIVASHPTYGLDVGAAEFVRSRLLAKAGEGSAVLLISEDLEEVLRLSDRVAVMFEGGFLAVLENKDLDRGRIMLLMAGSTDALEAGGRSDA
ncbi:MAG: ABC transporter ATP-binding protein [Elusimicrobia bacterium]|nr:ABC transporter ATP-binding protein [Elusimicrobiota bacterium]